MAGSTGSNRLSQIWRNTGSGFANSGVVLPGMAGAAVAWVDYDNDGWLDLLLSGNPGLGPVTQIWRNTGSNFVNIGASLPGASARSVAWGDYDNDGRLDLLLNNQLWRNTESGFVNVNAGLPNLTVGSCAWGDYDGDGRLDILITGLLACFGPDFPGLAKHRARSIEQSADPADRAFGNCARQNRPLELERLYG